MIATLALCGTGAAAVRVDQLGYAPGETKIAYLLAKRPSHARFAVIDAAGKVVLRGRAGKSRGRWNRRYRAVQPLDLTRLRAPGRYRVRVAGRTSPRFRIAPAAALLGPRVGEAVRFFQAQRDGADVIPSVMRRKPAHAGDRALSVYRPPRYDGPDSDVIVGRALKRIGGPVDLEGGWMDAGDFVKFTHTTAYAAALLFVAERELGPAAPPTLDPEARFGLAWLDKAWNATDRTLMLQVGIGSGNAKGTFNGDHDVWRLPEVDDTLTGAANRYLRSRPRSAPTRPASRSRRTSPDASRPRSRSPHSSTRRRSRPGRGRSSPPPPKSTRRRRRRRSRTSPPRCRTRSTRSPRGATTSSSAPPSCPWRPARSATRALPRGVPTRCAGAAPTSRGSPAATR
jgi:hypothetical protein